MLAWRLKKAPNLIVHKEAIFMNTVLTSGFLASLTLALTLMQAHAEQPQQCNAQQASYLIGQDLTPAIVQQARGEAGTTRVAINPDTQEFVPDRLRIVTDADMKITEISCG